MKYTSKEDKELWVIKTEAWEIPVLARRVEDESGEPFWMIAPGVFMNRQVNLILSGVLQPHSRLKANDQWVVPHGTLEKLGTNAPGITPRHYFKMNGEDAPSMTIETVDQEESPEFNDELVRTCWSKTRAASVGVFKAVWSALVNEIAYRLLIDRKPVDLGWFTIHAIPYRTNWKHNLLSKHPKLPAIVINSAEQRKIAMEISGVTSDLTRTDMMATSSPKGKTIFRWTLEIETNSQWDEYQEKLELQRLQGGTPASYLHRWGTLVRDSRKVINALLIQFCRNMAYSAGQPLQNPSGSGQRLVPYVPEKGGRPVRVDRVDLPLIVDDRPTAVRGPSDAPNAFRKAKEVPELPVLQLDISDLRNSR